ncbi:MAG: NADH dehydrogenase subunit [Ectothiorhodospiraceae bacterium]|nr:NADH dehydrogenase subunit [Ectothiorhodospiraceae bacterium]
MNISDTLRNAGLVGAGGAGFPTYVKTKAEIDYLIGNGAECEPLLHKDARLMEAEAPRVVRGMQLMAEATKAKNCVIGIKSKNQGAVDAIRAAAEGTNVTIHELQDYYPAGDEYELVHEIAKRLIPPKGIPLDVGCVTNNVETFFNVARAVDDGVPVTHKWLTITGAVREPITAVVPIGTTFRECIELAGGSTLDEFQMSLNGIMMGQWETDTEKRVTRTTGGIIVLPVDHHLMVRRSREPAKMHQIGKSACDQCTFCTELCPRYLLGYDVQPHKVMRSLEFTLAGEAMWNKWADLCCSCGLCTLYACPEDLYPKEACDRAKDDLREREDGWSGPMEVEAHPMKEYRKVPVKSLMKKLNLLKYEHHAPLTEKALEPDMVRIPLKMHIGAPAQPVVAVGDRVQCGQPIAETPADALGVTIHASIDGVVSAVNGEIEIHRS